MIIDADFGFSNIDVMLGVKTKYDLTDVICHRAALKDIIEEGREGVKFISGGSGMYELTTMGTDQLNVIVDQLLHLEDMVDMIIFDAGAGVSENMLRLIEASHETILVTTPEPTAVVDAYALIKMVSNETSESNIGLVINSAVSPKEAQVIMNSLTSIVKKNLQMDINPLGYILQDQNMNKAIKAQIPILISFPNSIASINIEMLANNYLHLPEEKGVKMGIRSFLRKFTERKAGLE